MRTSASECRAGGAPLGEHELFAELPARTLFFRDDTTGLRAILVIDRVVAGPRGRVSVGGIRTRAYESDHDQLADARRLAQAMSEKCALAGLPAGGAKCVVRDHRDLDRPAAFARLGEFVQELGGLYRCAGDLGTTDADLLAMGGDFVHRNTPALAAAVGRSWLACVRAAADAKGRPLAGLRVAIQGAGTIGEACARAAAGAGMEVLVSDLVAERAAAVAAAVGGAVLEADRDVFSAEVDVLAPCAVGEVVGEREAAELRAWALVGGANHILTSLGVDAILLERGVLHVPDVLASAGAVVDGIGERVMGLPDRDALIDRVGEVAAELLARSAAERRPTSQLARQRYERLIRAESAD